MKRLTKRISENIIELFARANPIQYNGSAQRVHIKHPFWNVFNKLCDYEDAEEQGLLLRLPCKIGATLWWTNAFGDLCSSEVNSMFIEKGIDGIVIETFICNIAGKEIGKTVFFTKEEAEQALARMEKENG